MIGRIWRALRGGSWPDYVDFLIASYRPSEDPGYQHLNIGFRLVVRVKGEGMVDVPKS